MATTSRTSPPASKNVNPVKSKGLGTFGGVFTPSILTILGVIMYLRFGWVVGNVGLIGTLLIVMLSTTITFLTSLSIASIATDQRVRIGGAYYMISRSLGIETGGAVGIPLYIAQTLSVALYTIGFAESFAGVFPQFNEKMVGLIVTVFVGILALFSAKVAIRSQYFIMTAIAISLVSLIFGKPLESTNIELWGAPAQYSESFWLVFAVFFPAVTGIMAGVNMSGDLKNPARSIPKGTFAAIGAGFLIYITLPVILANRADAQTLIDDPLIMRKISFWGDAILLGVWGATLSSAIGSIMGAPRVLQALAKDTVLPKWFKWLGKGVGKEETPRAGTILTLLIALVAVYFGNLNLVAPVLTMFFLTTYGVLNISAGLERFLGSPSFRPKFKVHWIFSLLGAVGCIWVMFLINALATFVAIIFIIIIFFWLESRELRTTWGDVRQGLWMMIMRTGLIRVSEQMDPKNWRPHILVLSGAPTKRWHLISLAKDFTQNRALMTVATVLSSSDISVKRTLEMEKNIYRFLNNRGITSLVRVFSAADPFKGAEHLVDTYGLGALVPNTIILGDTGSQKNQHKYCNMIRHFYRSQRNVMIIRQNEQRLFGNKKRIDIWWGGLKKNGGLMIILAYLLQKSLDWRFADIHIKMVAASEKAASGARENLSQIIQQMRIEVEYNVIVNKEGRSFDEILSENSRDADLIFLGLAEPEDDLDFTAYYNNLREKTEGLPSTVFVLASQEIAFGEVLL